ncbi:MAG: flavodoxin domain-containing protein, partial [Candidatus Helarchaeales archaeon]
CNKLMKVKEKMSDKKILIAFGSRYGGTALIAKKIAELLEKNDLACSLFDLKSSKSKNWPDITEFDGIIVGSGIMMGRWTGEAKKFLKKNKKILKEKQLPLGLFVGSGTAVEDPEKAREKYLKKRAAKLELESLVFDTFGAIYDLSESSKAGKFSRNALIAQTEEYCKKKGISPKLDGINEFIDEERLLNFVDSFVQLIK